ncbi:hypothetical protein [Williamsia sp. M5A3_1d]
MDALKAWRREGIDSARRELGSLKESFLVPIARLGLTEADEIREKLPPSAQPLAEEIASVMRAFVGSGQSAPTLVPDEPLSADPSLTPQPAPAPAPPAATDRADRSHSTPDALGDSGVGLSPDDFAEFDFTTSPETVHSIRVRAGGAATAVSWPQAQTAAGQVAVYRLVFSDDYPPYAPERADFVTATTKCSASFSIPFTSAVRHLQVWVNIGSDTADAVAEQPVLQANQPIVAPVTEITIREDEGRVIGEWSVFPGVSAVQVYRIPIERAAFGGDDPQYRIRSADANLGGFVDTGAERGRRYLYRMRAEVEIDGTTTLSAPAQADVEVKAVLEPVTDLSVASPNDHEDLSFDLTWTAPAAGKVVIFRTTGGPNAGSDSTAIPEGSLALAGLSPEDKLAHPIVAGADSVSAMRDVPWPREWNRAYFTAVTVLAGQARVGSTVSKTRTGRLQDARVVERVHKQIVTFEWPDGAASVLVYVAPRGHSAEAGVSGHPIEVTSGVYERFGGLHLPSPLPNGGCALHLVPVAFSNARRVLGTPITLDYPGLLRVSYDIEAIRKRGKDSGHAVVRIAAEVAVDGSPPFVLVHNLDRLPLSAFDGSALSVTPLDRPDVPAMRQFSPRRLTTTFDGEQYKVDLQGLTGFVRLFAQLPAERLRTFALLDPPMAKLSLGQSGRR